MKRKLHKSKVIQRVVLKQNSRHLDFETEIDYNESHELLKVDFNTNLNTDVLLSEIKFGYVIRPNHKSRPFDADRFEVCQHKWSPLAENGRGVAILNDNKYGISADAGRISLTLLKSAEAPALNADRGKHTFTYSLLPFSGNTAVSKVVCEAYELNVPLTMVRGMAREHSLLQVAAAHTTPCNTLPESITSG